MTEPAPRPLIGLTTYRQTAAWGSWKRDAAFLPGSYVDVVVRAGGQPVLVPPVADELGPGPPGAAASTGIDAVCRMLDGLVLTGGGDVDPDCYDQLPDPRTADTSACRDRLELEMLQWALDRGMPVLAVCRGLQVLNVALGGDLVQHLPDRTGSEAHRPAAGAFGAVVVTTEPGSHVHRLCGARLEVSCSHHQAVDRLGGGLRVTARSDDGTVEAAELDGDRFVVGVQWHPEEPGDVHLFEGLVAASRAAGWLSEGGAR
jgi:anthranilate synthase component 2/putative glutamine amidotransferase